MHNKVRYDALSSHFRSHSHSRSHFYLPFGYYFCILSICTVSQSYYIILNCFGKIQFWIHFKWILSSSSHEVRLVFNWFWVDYPKSVFADSRKFLDFDFISLGSFITIFILNSFKKSTNETIPKSHRYFLSLHHVQMV